MWAAVRGPEGRTIPSVIILVGVLSVCELSGSVLLDWKFRRFDGVTGWFVLLLCSLSLIFPAYLLLYTKPDLSFPLPRKIGSCEIGSRTVRCPEVGTPLSRIRLGLGHQGASYLPSLGTSCRQLASAIFRGRVTSPLSPFPHLPGAGFPLRFPGSSLGVST